MNLFSIFKRKTSSQIAKDRLKILLISDRVDCSPEMMELIKNDIALTGENVAYAKEYENRCFNYGDSDIQDRKRCKKWQKNASAVC